MKIFTQKKSDRSLELQKKFNPLKENIELIKIKLLSSIC